jgi:hypothetical protein
MLSEVFVVFAWKSDNEHRKFSSDYEYELERLKCLKGRTPF